MSKNTSDNPAVTALVAALIDGTINASTLFEPPAVIPRTGKAASSYAFKLRSEARKLRLVDEEDDRPLTEIQAKEKLRIILTELIRYTFRSEVIARILSGRKTLAEAVHEKDKPLLEGFARFVSTTFNVSVEWEDISGYNFVGLMRDIWKRGTKEPSPIIGLDGSDDEWDVADAEHEEDVVAETRKARAAKPDPVKVTPKEKPFDNSPNWGLNGRMNQRRIDAQNAAATPVQVDDLAKKGPGIKTPVCCGVCAMPTVECECDDADDDGWN